MMTNKLMLSSSWSVVPAVNLYCHSFTLNDVFEFLRRDPVLKKSFSVPHHSNSRLTHKIQKTLLMSLSDFVRHLLAHSPYFIQYSQHSEFTFVHTHRVASSLC